MGGVFFIVEIELTHESLEAALARAELIGARQWLISACIHWRNGLFIGCSLKVSGWFSHPTVINAGNLVRIEDGCATVTGYKLPSPLVPLGTGKAGARFETL
jgi:hypothetical protein